MTHLNEPVGMEMIKGEALLKGTEEQGPEVREEMFVLLVWFK